LLPAFVLVFSYLTVAAEASAYAEKRSSDLERETHVIPSEFVSGGWARFVTLRKTAPLTTTLEGGSNEGTEGSPVAFFRRFGDSSWSTGLHESRYAYDIIESIHVWALALFFGLAVMFDLRLLGWTMRTVPVSEVARRLLPWTIAGFVIMVISGSLLFSAIPLRSYQNIFFRFKMLMILLAGLNVWIFHSGVYRRVSTWDVDAVPPKAARIAGALSLALWISIVLSGRMIAYNWFDCDRQPQPAIINFLTSCVPTASEH
jgi:hypothetical protein